MAHGGGGFCDPLERDPQSVQKDILNGCVSPEWASGIYGVVLEPGSLKVVSEATEARRKELKADRLQRGQRMKRQLCPFNGDFCSDNCALFGDIVIDGSTAMLMLHCGNSLAVRSGPKDRFKDRRRSHLLRV